MRPFRRGAVVLAGLGVSCVAVLQTSHALVDAGYQGIAPICRVSTTEPVVALSFDDGPDPAYTPLVLDLLRENGSDATFFPVGVRAAEQPGLIREEIAQGAELGDHTWDHPHLAASTAAATLAQANRSRSLLAMDGGNVRLFRPPYGEITPAELRLLRDEGFVSVVWSAALDHYVGGMGLPPVQAAASLAGDVGPGDIILGHDAHLLPIDGGGARNAAMDALTMLLPALRSEGYRVVSVGELLKLGAPVRATPRPWFWQAGFTCPR